MKDELAMVLCSRRTLTESLASEQISALSNFGDGLMRPDKCSEYEPIRTPFNPADISEPIRWLAKPHGEFFYRKGSPVHVAGEMWNLTHSPTARFPSPPFANKWTARFDGKWAGRVGIKKIEDFVQEMFRVTSSDFGLLSSEADMEAKNQSTKGYSYKGLDPASGVPGLYWVNLFSEQYANWLGLYELPRELAMLEKLAGGGVSLKFCKSSEDCRNLEVLQKQRAAIDWLGPQRFFDIRFPDRKLEVPEWGSLPFRSEESTAQE
jgi:hypothetical protein